MSLQGETGEEHRHNLPHRPHGTDVRHIDDVPGPSDELDAGRLSGA